MQPVAYAYNVQVHKSTNTTPFSLVLLRHAPGPTTPSQPSVLSSVSYVDPGLRWLKLSHQHKIAALQAKASLQLEEQGSQYKRHYNAKVRVKAESLPNQKVFVDKLPSNGKGKTVDERSRAR